MSTEGLVIATMATSLTALNTLPPKGSFGVIDYVFIISQLSAILFLSWILIKPYLFEKYEIWQQNKIRKQQEQKSKDDIQKYAHHITNEMKIFDDKK